MADWVCRIAAIAKNVSECLKPGDRLVLSKSNQQIGKLMLRNGKLADGLSERNKHRMLWRTRITSVQFSFPLVEHLQRLLRVAYLIAQIVGDAAVGIDVIKMLAQTCWEKPRGYRKIFVMGARQALAIALGFFERRGCVGNAIGIRQRIPAGQAVCGRC